MTYPAWFAFHKDKEIHEYPATARVYAALVELQSIFFEPRPIKAWVLAEALGIKKRTVLRSLNILTTKGYIVEHDRDMNNVRRFTVAFIAHPIGAVEPTSAPEGPDSHAA